MIHVPLITPFAPDGRLDTTALGRLAHELLDDGATGLVALGTTGEPAALDDDERAEVAAVVGRACRERGAFFTVGVGAAGTRRAAAELHALAALPVPPDAALVTVPSFVRPGEAGVLAHFRSLAATTSLPLLAYHVPYRTAQPLSAETLLALAAIPGVTGMKYAPGALDADTTALLSALPDIAARKPDAPGVFGQHDPFTVLAGDDVLAPALFALGAQGGILASGHLATRHWVRLAAAPTAPDAGILGHRLAALATALFSEPNPAVLKAVLHAQHRIPTPDVRLPLLPAASKNRDAALAALADLDVLPSAPSGVTPA
ncbi:dihydrodipicolinate synthase family protein [Streptomyces sp. V4-01]|uniref:Dihydrodipicolinate synthase family protein n=1 Tax=Actinacidiphila polyblastidii TaxID=3110430 RepID=A0ABU7PKH2_9ACTN|nr:dihydrodipicolinate synthase family protein [Streptomyces sp. V4-01]